MRQESHRDRLQARGAAAVEVALVMVAVVGAMFLGGWLLSRQTQQTWERVNSLQIVSFDSERSAATRPAAVSTKSRPEPAPAVADAPPRRDLYFGYAAATVCIALLGEGVILLRRRRKRTEEQPTPETDPSQLPLRLFEKRQDLLRRLAEAACRGKLHGVLVRDVMTRSVATLQNYTPIAEVGRVMQERRVRHVLICDDQDRLLGIVSDRDLSQRMGRFARDIMSRRIISVSGDTELIPAVTTMMNRGISALPILLEGRPIGILTTTDALLVLQCMLLLKHRDETPADETL